MRDPETRETSIEKILQEIKTGIFNEISNYLDNELTDSIFFEEGDLKIESTDLNSFEYAVKITSTIDEKEDCHILFNYSSGKLETGKHNVKLKSDLKKFTGIVAKVRIGESNFVELVDECKKVVEVKKRGENSIQYGEISLDGVLDYIVDFLNRSS